MDVGAKVIDIIAEQAILDPGDVTLESTLDSLGIDSMGLVESIFAIEEAFDILDAYCDDFKQDPSGKGKQILGNIFSVLEASAAHFELWEEYKSLL